MLSMVRGAVALSLLLSACARGSEASGIDQDFDFASGDAGHEDAGDDAGGYVTSAPPMSGQDPTSPMGAGQDAGLAPGPSGSGGSGGSGGNGGDVDIQMMCAAMDSCYQARRIGELAGDKSGAPVVATGTHSEWLNVRVREESNAARGLNVVLRLHSEGSADYDLFVYRADASSGMMCTGESEASAVSGPTTEEVKMSWGDTYIFGDDSRTLSVEVRHVGGDCKPWVLEVFRP